MTKPSWDQIISRAMAQPPERKPMTSEQKAQVEAFAREFNNSIEANAAETEQGIKTIQTYIANCDGEVDIDDLVDLLRKPA